ncbi:alpha/beta-hydrolase [Pseudovirgaria hyperparasitica]|uniref:Carboxypeptidase n=1 Tax=Pseudovirgaria hyperparasitica TaxID=470096 RepID=A0A6A6W718_9PEZI|nr:alpha/beta-hydrolase [Pseudovirgaria hyperparasitica]KAF2758678.1 alpha/beta-hydrolase [Pseudovirgaria hyperparasitica]
MRALHGLTVAVVGFSRSAAAQFPPTPTDITIVNSTLEEGVYISYKETELCETTEGVRSFSGYVHLPPQTLEGLDVDQDYPINTYFWFFEARNDPQNAPLSIWMNGGPGSSSMLGLMREHGPCYVNADSNSTYLNEHSWNNNVNMLYLDQPVQVGLSYDTLQNVTVDLNNDTRTADFSNGVPEQNNTYYVGTYASQNRNYTTKGTENSARAMWYFAQTWFQEFPEHKPNNDKISISTESYGGRYGPAFAAFFQEQNDKIANGTWTESGETHILHLDTLLIINGCIDRLVQWPSYPMMAYNNTYGIEAINHTRYEAAMDAFTREGGCSDQIIECRKLAAESDPTNQGFNDTVNGVCEAAETFCGANIRDPYLEDSGRNYYDISAINPAAFPVPFYAGWLNQPHVQQGLGVPRNWTQSSGPVSTAFRSIGDYPRPGWLEDLTYLLESGVKVTLVYGDRDYACNWFGGEAVSKAINYTNTEAFNAAGYAGIQVNDSYIGGQVRQYGNLSFSRVYEAGHEVPAYQPETALRIFERALFNMDIATGQINTAENANYGTEGPTSTFDIKNEVIPMPAPTCYVLDPDQCTDDQWESVSNGTALVRNWIVVDENTIHLFPDLNNGSIPGPSPTPTPPASGASSLGRDGNVIGVPFGMAGSAAVISLASVLLILL